jgi:ATP-binding cassette subfamily C protein LapB
MGLLNQNAHLFFGSVRENLTLGSPLATDQELLNVLKLTGALSFVLDKKEGLDHQVLEGGVVFWWPTSSFTFSHDYCFANLIFYC